MATTTVANEINEYIANCNGTNNVYRHMFSRIVYTDGVKFVAEKAGAYWLIDAIMSHQTNRKAIAAANGFQVWKVTHNKRGSGCVLTMDDGGQGDEAKVLIRQRIPFTDFPKGLDLVFYVEHGMLLLREER